MTKLPATPTYFHKPVSSLCGHRARVVRPERCKWLNYEGEIAIVIGRHCRNINQSRGGWRLHRRLHRRERLRTAQLPRHRRGLDAPGEGVGHPLPGGSGARHQLGLPREGHPDVRRRRGGAGRELRRRAHSSRAGTATHSPHDSPPYVIGACALLDSHRSSHRRADTLRCGLDVPVREMGVAQGHLDVAVAEQSRDDGQRDAAHDCVTGHGVSNRAVARPRCRPRCAPGPIAGDGRVRAVRRFMVTSRAGLMLM